MGHSMREDTDSELVNQYLDGDQNAMRLLVERHYKVIYSRFRREFGNADDAEDLSQQLWLQVSRNLKRYEDQGKFPQYLSSIAANLIKVHWRSKNTRKKYFSEHRDDDEYQSISDVAITIDASRYSQGDEAVRYLSEELIPGLPSEQRMAWLLRHESEYWDPAVPMKWEQLAELYGISVVEAWGKFEQARESFMCTTQESTSLDTDDVSIFMVWTQAQRAAKEQDFTWDYFSKLLGVPVNTMKTRYRAAHKHLRAELVEHTDPLL